MFRNNPMQRALIVLVLMVASLMANHEFTLTLVHTNDVHTHYVPFDEYGAECSESMLAKGECYGGVARIKAAVDTIRQQYPNVVLCDAGDQAQGTLLFTVHRYNITSHFTNALHYDVMCVGNDEFGYGEEAVVRFSKAVRFPLISANLIHGEVQGAKITKSTILQVADEKIGFIGYTTTDTNFRATPGRFAFSDEVEAVRKEVAVLQAQNVTKIIALGHAGIEKDKEIAKYIEGVDVVVGGHSHTFLYDGPPPGNDAPQGPYPVVISQPSGKKVPVVQAYKYGKYLGLLTLRFDQNGEVIKWSGNPILLNSSYPEDLQVREELAPWNRPIEVLKRQIVAETHVLLDYTTCRYAECNIGNLVVDAFIRYFNKNPPHGAWANVAIAMTNGGSIRTSLPPGNITRGNLYNVQPFDGSIDLVSLRGEHIQEILEFCIRTSLGKGGFLQFSGLQVEYEYNPAATNTSRVVSVKARCAACLVPTYFPLQMDRTYRIATNGFLIRGGDGYTHFKKYGMNITSSGRIGSEILLTYVEAVSPISQGLDTRIMIRNTSTTQGSGSTTSTSSSLLPRSSSHQITHSFYIMSFIVIFCVTDLLMGVIPQK